MDTYLLVCALIFAVIGSVGDVCCRRIPNLLTYYGFLGALLVRLLTLGWPGLKDGVIASLAGSGVLFVLFLLGGMGAGDVKLMAAVAAWGGSTRVVNLLFGTAVAGGVMAVGVILHRKRVVVTVWNAVELLRHHLIAGLRPHPELNIRGTRSMRVPFAPAIAIGTLYCWSLTLLWG